MARQKTPKKTYDWPSWRYGPEGESAIFKCAEDVPEGWTKKPGEPEAEIENKSIILDHEEIHQQLVATGFMVPGWMSTARKKEILDGMS